MRTIMLSAMLALVLGLSSWRFASANDVDGLCAHGPNSWEQKVTLENEARQALDASDYARLTELVARLKTLCLFEETNYEYVLFEAALMIERGKLEEARVTLSGYADILRIAAGISTCSPKDGMVVEGGIERESRLAYDHLCAEVFLSSNGNLTYLGLQELSNKWSNLDRMRERLLSRM